MGWAEGVRGTIFSEKTQSYRGYCQTLSNRINQLDRAASDQTEVRHSLAKFLGQFIETASNFVDWRIFDVAGASTLDHSWTFRTSKHYGKGVRFTGSLS